MLASGNVVAARKAASVGETQGPIAKLGAGASAPRDEAALGSG
ncbi:MAG TPA: hypothetical protein VFU86_14390 [Terriglobales bacterium]|nr:hypothetical protein [Terriglobales bacterium]